MYVNTVPVYLKICEWTNLHVKISGQR